MTVRHTADELVDAYLKYLGEAAEPLPEERRTELLAEVRTHVAEERAAGVVTPEEVRAMLARLGDPDEIVAAATDGLVMVKRQPRFRSRDVATLLLLSFGGFLYLLGWVAGVALLWTSDRWTREEKLLGTLVLPFGFLPVALLGTLSTAACRADLNGEILGCGGYTYPGWFQVPIMIALAAVQLVALFVLVKNARPRRSAGLRG
ncbi:HAAS signaling domain-containing protein [Kribbella sp. DT2]|uniref:HAAS signaling domain-containing protein n=1 Tax=Kribbella sp. DT2 TaxID=3393427 RepID=UPI003CEDBD38